MIYKHAFQFNDQQITCSSVLGFHNYGSCFNVTMSNGEWKLVKGST
jgi:hypothetical protein